MGELPTADHSKAGWARWAIPLTLAAVVAAAAVYEWMRPAGESHVGATKDAVAPAAHAPKRDAATTPANPAEGSAPLPQSTGVAPSDQNAGTALPNPLAAAAPGSDAAQVAGAATSPAKSGVAATPPSMASAGATMPATPAAGSTDAAPGAAPTSAAPAATSGGLPLVVEFRNNSWTEIRDGSGRVLLSGMNAGGTAQTLSGTPPIEIVIGNASHVSLRYKGQPVDLAPYMRQGVARFTLR